MKKYIPTWIEFEEGLWESIFQQGFLAKDFDSKISNKDFVLIAKKYNLCIDCNNYHSPSSIYIVKSKIWKKYVGDFDAGLLCKKCLSKRMGRKLRDSDYIKGKKLLRIKS